MAKIQLAITSPIRPIFGIRPSELKMNRKFMVNRADTMPNKFSIANQLLITKLII